MSGVFGVVGDGNCRRDLLLGTDYQSHLGTEQGGLVTWHPRRGFRQSIHSIETQPFRPRFLADPKFEEMGGPLGIGAISDFDPQPLLMNARFGQIAVAAVGLVNNQRQLATYLIRQGASFVEMSRGQINMIELLGKLISQGTDLIDGLEKAWRAIQGSASVVMIAKDGLIAARDSLGRTPLALAKKHGSLAVATETCAFSNLGYELDRFLGPGEIIQINRSGEVSQLRPPNSDLQICAFLWIYTSNPASIVDGVEVASARVRSGQLQARRETVHLQGVTGIPDSGLFHAYGFAMESGLPFIPLTIKYPTWTRSYTPPNQQVREEIAHMKQVILPQLLHCLGISKVAVLEDSIVRGTQLRKQTIPKIYRTGVKEIHIRPDCPPLMWPCRYLRSTRRLVDLAARRAIAALEGEMPQDVSAYLEEGSKQYQAMVEHIRQELKVASLRYQTLTDMVAAIGLPREQLCTYCWTGQG
jgi:amidophosphoribosyltransferase